MGEAVTLAHVVRPVVLAQSLDPQQYAVILACDKRYRELFGKLPFEIRALWTIPSAQFIDALAKGKPVYDTDTLRSYVREDLALIEAVRPDLVIGDFRISLGISARIAGVPYFTITNAYWSPYARLPLPLPEHPVTQVLGLTLSQALFNLVYPLVFAYHTLPLNRVRRDYGLPSLSYDLREIYTQADQTLYADIPNLVPTIPLPPHHHWLGPILWSPMVAPPVWWSALPDDKPIVYVTLGSSSEGNQLLSTILQGLSELPITVIAATAGRPIPTNLPANARVAAFLPGTEAATRSRLVICNGGSPTTQQAFSAGVPVIGIAGNMDQHLNMICLERVGAGLRLRVGQLTAKRLQTTVEQLLNGESYGEGARKLMQIIRAHDTGRVFAQRVAAQIG
jgi:UDP:flavonoid glycosyltransferase YjiC (YdhE family)